MGVRTTRYNARVRLLPASAMNRIRRQWQCSFLVVSYDHPGTLDNSSYPNTDFVRWFYMSPKKKKHLNVVMQPNNLLRLLS